MRPAALRVARRQVDGVLLLDKPSGLSSNAALQRAKRLYRAQKAGHTGTLDPLASGLLPICFGEATKFAQGLLDADKAYAATVRFGTTTTTGDAAGGVTATHPVSLSRHDVEAALPHFGGRIAQVPPRHAALKHQGRKYYEYARRGVEIPRPAREVEIRELTLRSWRAPDLDLFVRCSKGTYIRSLAEDLGSALGCGAHLAALRRTATGGFALGDAVTLEALEQMSESQRDAMLRPAEVLVAGLPRLDLDGTDAIHFGQGRPLARPGLADGPMRVYANACFAGIGVLAEGMLRPRRLISARAPRSMAETVES
jgi:tRNA pseudouridine55 synthase